MTSAARSSPSSTRLPSLRTPTLDALAAASQTSPACPSRDPAMFRGIGGERELAADPSTEADSAGALASLLGGAGATAGPKPHVRVGNTPPDRGKVKQIIDGNAA